MTDSRDKTEDEWRATLTPEQFRGFVCDNAVRMYGEANPDFFLGTVIEGYAKTLAAPTP